MVQPLFKYQLTSIHTDPDLRAKVLKIPRSDRQFHDLLSDGQKLTTINIAVNQNKIHLG